MGNLTSFPLSWRFLEKACPPLPGPVLQVIAPVPEDLSRRLWAELAAPQGEHLMECLHIILSKDATHRLLSADLWDEDMSPKDLECILRGHLITVWQTYTPIIVFWDAELAVLTRWHVFLQYWDDFFYPSDECGVVASLDSTSNLLFVGGRLYSVDRGKVLARERAERGH